MKFWYVVLKRCPHKIIAVLLVFLVAESLSEIE